MAARRSESRPAAVAPQALAHRPDFKLGAATVKPSLRILEGPAGKATAEPRVVQVLLALVDAKGAVVSRDDLIRDCWAGRVVGDDAINRVIAELRRIARETQAGFVIETIARVGYRLIDAGSPAVAPPLPTASEPERPSRRLVIVSGLAAAGIATTLWLATRRGGDPSATELIEDGRRELREAWPGRESRSVELLRQAVAIDPGNAEAWGLLAVAWRNVAESASADKTSAAVSQCEAAARRALELNPREGNALAARAVLHPSLGDWIDSEDRLRSVLEVAPDNVTALSHLTSLLQSVGRANDSWNLNERALAVEPLSPIHQFRKALKFWIYGRVPEADLAIDRALQLWPRHPAVWNARLYLFAFTGRPDAAATLIKDGLTRPPGFTTASEQFWQRALAALASRSRADVADATQAVLGAAPADFAVSGIMVLSALGELDAAFALADGFLLRRGPLVGSLWPTGEQMPINDQRWRRTMNLFTPATAAMRGDARFSALCTGIGLTAYWQARGIGPDPFLMKA